MLLVGKFSIMTGEPNPILLFGSIVCSLAIPVVLPRVYLDNFLSEGVISLQQMDAQGCSEDTFMVLLTLTIWMCTTESYSLDLNVSGKNMLPN